MSESEVKDMNVESSAKAAGDYQNQFKRLTIDIPASLHRTIKSQCALRGTKIADEIRELLMYKYEGKKTDN